MSHSKKTPNNVSAGLDDIRGMIRRWRHRYEKDMTPGADNEWLVKEFAAEVDDYLTNFAHHMYYAEMVDKETFSNFLGDCYNEVAKLEMYRRRLEATPLSRMPSIEEGGGNMVIFREAEDSKKGRRVALWVDGNKDPFCNGIEDEEWNRLMDILVYTVEAWLALKEKDKACSCQGPCKFVQ